MCSVRWEAAPCGLDSAPPGAAGWRRSTPPPFRGLGNFAAQRSRGMARYPGVPTRLAVWGGQGKIAVERCRRTATRAKAPGRASERGCMDEAVFPERDSCQRRGGSSERSTRGDIEDPGVKRQREPAACSRGQAVSVSERGMGVMVAALARCRARQQTMLGASGLSVSGPRPGCVGAAGPLPLLFAAKLRMTVWLAELRCRLGR